MHIHRRKAGGVQKGRKRTSRHAEIYFLSRLFLFDRFHVSFFSRIRDKKRIRKIIMVCHQGDVEIALALPLALVLVLAIPIGVQHEVSKGGEDCHFRGDTLESPWPPLAIRLRSRSWYQCGPPLKQS
jgi:hypothetical protein